jgi:hypothetical protein
LLAVIFKDLKEIHNVTVIFKHWCNPDKVLSYKLIYFLLQPALKYPTRVWESLSTAIALNTVEQKFNQLPGKKDLI